VKVVRDRWVKYAHARAPVDTGETHLFPWAILPAGDIKVTPIEPVPIMSANFPDQL
jgi:polyphosphate kinase 2 (PPK2 family)